MFSQLTFSQQQFIYLGLKALIESKAGFGFIKGNPAHPVYQEGSLGKDPLQTEYPDSPEKNTLFIMLSELSGQLKECGIEDMGYKWWYDFSTWENFCKFAVAVAKGGKT
ncbi:MAG: hypothetical protein AB1585_04880 [Thermodesulfobacteriota bacterium]